MTILVAGCAALHDLIATADEPAPRSTIGVLRDGPGARGRWLPGGSAPTVALAIAAQGLPVALWHPLPNDVADDFGLSLAGTGIDLSRCPNVETSAYCVLIRVGEEASAWSSRMEVPGDIGAVSFDGIDHLVVCPVWGPWTTTMLAAAVRAGIPYSLVGALPEAALAYEWQTVTINERQATLDLLGRVHARVLAVTLGSEGSRIRDDGAWREIAPVRVAVVDPTGAGDVYAGTLIGALERGKNPAAAAATASERAAMCSEHWGAQTLFTEPVPLRSAGQDARVRGALWGLACGDAFGMPGAFLPPLIRAKRLGIVTELVDGPPENPYHAGYPAGRITDDTEQAQALTRAFLASVGPLDPEAVARELSAWLDASGGPEGLAVGPSTRRGLLAWREGLDIDQTGRFGTSNGAAMRIAPVGIVHGLRGSDLDLLADDVVAACLVTHNTGVAISAACAVAAAIAAGISGATWSSVIAAAVEGARRGSGHGAWVYAPSVAARIALACRLARGGESDAACLRTLSDVVGTGEPSAEAVPAAFGLFARVRGDPEAAIRLAGNLEGDSDTIGAIAGAICGAYAGEDVIPLRWRMTVTNVNRLDVDGWADQLTQVARAAVPGAAR
jgi:ADP-ribosylglycohydrolase/sugar/nucleoside kinase (ribokinase family)